MIRDTASTRVIQLAVATLGGREQFASDFGVSVTDVDSWMVGTAVPPNSVFIAALDVVAGGSVDQK